MTKYSSPGSKTKYPATPSYENSTFRLKWATGLAALGFCAATLAAPPGSWWIDIANDRESNVRNQLAQGIDPNAVDAEGLPALMLAIRTDSWKAYDALLAHRDIKVEVENRHGETPLMYLALLGDTERARALIARGAQVNRLGWTPLHYAASKAQVDTGRMLLEQKAMVNAPAPDGTTPLMMAAYSGSREMAQLLLEYGADATAVNLQQLTASEWARERGNTRLATELDQIAELTQARREGRIPAEPAEAPREKRAPQDGSSRYFDLDRFDREED